MKLKLPLALQLALFAGAGYALAQDATTVLNPVEDGGVTNNGSNYYLSQNVTWQQDYQYNQGGTATVLSVGTMYGAGVLQVENESAVDVAGSLHIGGWGWGSGYNSAKDIANSGEVYVGKGSSMVVGAALNVDATNSQLNIGAGGPKDAGVKGSMVVDGGTVTTNYALNVGLGNGASGELTVKNGGQVIVQSGSNVSGYASTAFYVGYYEGSEGRVVVEGEGSSLTVGAKDSGYAMTYMGLGASSGVLEIRDGATVNLQDGGAALTILGYDAKGSGSIIVDNANISSSNTYVGYSGNGTLTASNGSGVEVDGQLIISGWNAGKTGSVSIDGSGSTLEVSGVTCVGHDEGTSGSLEVSGGASAQMQDVSLVNDSMVSVTGASRVTMRDAVLSDSSSFSVGEGSSATATGDVVVTSDSKLTVQNGNLVVEGAFTNEGETTVTLDAGYRFEAGAVANTGAMEVTVHKGATYEVGSYINQGTSVMTAEEGAECHFGTLTMAEGSSMTMSGEGSYVLGKTSEGGEKITTTFTVSVSDLNEIASTYVDISTLQSKNFTIDTQSDYTLYFTDEVLQQVVAATPSELDLELMVVKGYAGFSMDEQALAEMLASTSYEYAGGRFRVSGVGYEMKGDNLVWKGTLEVAVPEPATATLSLLALAALAARRRRK